jgi:predicted nucleotide-binding protein
MARKNVQPRRRVYAPRKPKLFIASSTEGRPIAETASDLLHHVAVVTPWWRLSGLKNGTYVPRALVEATSTFDFGLFILTCDDVTISRKRKKSAPRDNVIFEFGLFWGALGQERVFAIVERKKDRPAEVPTDLFGIHYDRFERAIDPEEFEQNLSVALRTVADTIKKKQRREVRLVGPVGFVYKPEEVAAVAIIRRDIVMENQVLLDGKRLALFVVVSPGPGTDVTKQAGAASEVVSAKLSSEDINLSVPLNSIRAKLKPGHQLRFFVLRVPADVDSIGGTLAELESLGCDVIKRCAITIRRDRPKRR